VCQAFVTGTASGHCPRCGWVPPSTCVLPERASRARWPWLVALGLAAIVVFAITR